MQWLQVGWDVTGGIEEHDRGGIAGGERHGTRVGIVGELDNIKHQLASEDGGRRIGTCHELGGRQGTFKEPCAWGQASARSSAEEYTELV